MSQPNPLRDLPAVHEVLHALGRSGPLHKEAVRVVLAGIRDELKAGKVMDLGIEAIAGRVRRHLDRPGGLRRVINATGILLHTGLGRAPLAREAIEAIAETAGGYANLEFDLDSGDRGRRTDGVEAQLRAITGAEAAAVVNNNAAATILALKAVAGGRDVVVSRGQLVEIGGSFRLPEIFEVSGARLREVGTTNITRLSDYARAIGPETGALLRVHTGNYRVVGFTESVPVADLARLAHERGLPLIDDIGSGALADDAPPGLSDEPNAARSIAAGADLVLFSGDKLLGGPQCGVLVGRTDPIRAIQADPLARAMRVDKLTIAALEATLRLVREAPGSIPFWRMLMADLDGLQRRAESLARRIETELQRPARAVTTSAHVGGGSVPADAIPSWGVRLDGGDPGPAELARRLRMGRPAAVGRVKADALWLDLRAVDPDEDGALLEALRTAWDG